MADQPQSQPTSEALRRVEQQRRRYQRELKAKLLEPRDVFFEFIRERRPPLLQDVWDSEPKKRTFIWQRAEALVMAWDAQKYAFMKAYLHERKTFKAIGEANGEVQNRELSAATVRKKVIQAVSYFVCAMNQSAAEAQRLCDEARLHSSTKRSRRALSARTSSARPLDRPGDGTKTASRRGR